MLRPRRLDSRWNLEAKEVVMSNYHAVMSGQPIRAIDIMTLRSYLNDDLQAADLTYPWTWTTVSPGNPIQAKHLTEIR